MSLKLLLIEDVDALGRSGDVVSVKPGFARNFLLPKKKGVMASKHTLRMQEELRQQRFAKAAEEKKEAEELAAHLHGQHFAIEVKVDPDGHMYGSVSANDIVHILADHGFRLDRRNVILASPIKTLGVQTIHLKLAENVPAEFTIEVMKESSSL